MSPGREKSSRPITNWRVAELEVSSEKTSFASQLRDVVKQSKRRPTVNEGVGAREKGDLSKATHSVKPGKKGDVSV